MNNDKLRVHPSMKCSKCGKSQEDGVKVFDYYHVGEGVFCTECRNPDTYLKEYQDLQNRLSLTSKAKVLHNIEDYDLQRI